ADAATCANTPPSASTASFAWNASGKERPRSSGPFWPTSSPSGAPRRWRADANAHPGDTTPEGSGRERDEIHGNDGGQDGAGPRAARRADRAERGRVPGHPDEVRGDHGPGARLARRRRDLQLADLEAAADLGHARQGFAHLGPRRQRV